MVLIRVAQKLHAAAGESDRRCSAVPDLPHGSLETADHFLGRGPGQLAQQSCGRMDLWGLRAHPLRPNMFNH